VVALEAELILARKLLGMTSEPGKQMPVGVGFITCHETVAHFSETVLPLLEEHKPAAVWLFAPDPASRVRAHPDIIRRLHESGIKAIVQVGSVAAAREAIQDGSDIIVAQGTDAGGHQFALGAGLMTLVPEIRAMMQAEFPARQVGLVAAGGIMNGGGVVAALALGELRYGRVEVCASPLGHHLPMMQAPRLLYKAQEYVPLRHVSEISLTLAVYRGERVDRVGVIQGHSSQSARWRRHNHQVRPWSGGDMPSWAS